MTAALEGAECSAARPGRTLPLGKTRYPFYKRLGGPQGRSGRAENLVPTGIRSRTVQSVVSRYTDWATWPTPSKLNVLYFTKQCYIGKSLISNETDYSTNPWKSVRLSLRCRSAAILTYFLYSASFVTFLEKQKCVCIPWTTLLQL